MEGSRKTRDTGLSAMLIAPDRAMAQQFNKSLAETRAFQILTDLKSYPTRNTLDIRLRQLRPEAVLIDVASDPAAAADLVQFVASWRPAVPPVALHSTNDSAALVSALRLGAVEFLFAPFDSGAQREALARIRRLRQPEGEVEEEAGKVIVFSAAKPGAGSSTLAAHTAQAVRQATGKRVLLVDLDLEGGTIGFLLKAQSAGSVADALDQAGSLDPGTWINLVANSEGVDILPAPEAPVSESADPARIHDLFEFTRMFYDWVIVDAPVIFHRTSLLAISECEKAYLVSTGDLASLHLARRGVKLLEQLGFSRDRYDVVVNRLGRRDIATADMEKIFNAPVRVSIPNDYFSLHRVISLGQPLAENCEAGKAIAALASSLAAPVSVKRPVPPPPSPAAPLVSHTG
jgi:pilus assembly protein CpaE